MLVGVEHDPTSMAAKRPIAVHLYHPADDIGGALGMLDFQRERIVALVERGYHDAVQHDCARSQCLNIADA